MTPFDCGCTHDGATRCATHAEWACHDTDGMCPNCVTPWRCNGPHLSGDVCPPCRLARLRSVSLSADATPTRRRAS